MCSRTDDRLFFVRSRDRLSVTQIVRERYVRQLRCMATPCTQCDADASLASLATAAVRGDGALWIVPGVTCCAFFGELLERARDVVLLQSVLARVADVSPSAARRLRTHAKDATHRCSVLLNECHADLALARVADENESEASLAVRRLVHACLWLAEHGVHGTARRVLLVSDNADVCLVARQFGVDVCSVAELTQLLWPGDAAALDLCAALAEAREAAERRRSLSAVAEPALFATHLGDDALQAGVRSMRFLRGTLHVNRRLADVEAWIAAADLRVYVFGLTDRNRAMSGDTVAVELLPRSGWKERPRREDAAAADAPLRAGGRDAVPTGRVVGIFERRHAEIVGTLRAPDAGGSGAVMVVPLLRELPLLRLPTTRTLPASGVSQRVVVHFDEWLASRRFPDAHIVRRIGDAGSLDVELEALLAAAGVESRPLSPIGASMLPPLLGPAPFGGSHWRLPDLSLLSAATSFRDFVRGVTPPPGSAPFRCDLRGLRAMSVDPLGCVDIDDALSFTAGREWKRLAATLPRCPAHPVFTDVRDGDRIVGVHIADVAYFSHEGSLHDLEARARGTTVYLPDRRFDMNPAELSEDLCSLRGDTERFVQTVLVRFRPGGDASRAELGAVAAPPGMSACAWFGRASIRSRHALAYEEAQRLHDENDPNNVTAQDLRALTLLTRELRQVRIDNGALELDSVEPHFTLDPETNAPVAVVDALDIEMKRVIAELMIMANCLVAQRIHRTMPQCALLRNHAPPTEDAVAAFRALAAARGVEIDAVSNATFAQSLDAAVARFDNAADFALTLRSEAARALSEATYVSSGAAPDLAHYGLAVPLYTHFTSPIRRYADMVVQRQLWYCLCLEQQRAPPPAVLPFSSHAVADVCEDLNRFTRASRQVQRDSADLFLALYFARFPQEARALIRDVREDACVCVLPRFGLEVVVHFAGRSGAAAAPVARGPRGTAVARVACSVDEQRVHVTLSDQSTLVLCPFDALDVFVEAADSAAARYRVPPPRVTLRAVLAPRVPSGDAPAPAVRDVAMPRAAKAARSAAAALRPDVEPAQATPGAEQRTMYDLLRDMCGAAKAGGSGKASTLRGKSLAVRMWKEDRDARRALESAKEQLLPSLADELGDGGLLDNVSASNERRYAKLSVAAAAEVRAASQQHFNERKASRFRKARKGQQP
jgi:exoribonuclease R